MKEKLQRIFHSPAASCLWHWAKPCRPAVFAICFLEALQSAGTILATVGMKGLIDGAVSHDLGMLQKCAVLLILTVLVKRGLALLENLLSVRANTALQQSLQTHVLKELMKKQYGSLTAFHSGELVSRMLSDVQVVKNGILEILPDMVRMTVGFCGAALILIYLDWRLVLLMIAGGLLGLLMVVLLETPMKKRHTAVQEAEAKYHASLQETLENILLVKASGSEGRMERQIGGKQEQLAAAQRKKGHFSAWMNQGITLIFQLSWIVCLLWGGIGIYRGSLTYGMLTAMLQLVSQVQGPISGMAGMAGQVYAAVSSAERIRQLLELPEEPSGEDADVECWTEIRMQDLSFSYERDAGPVLKNVNCSVFPGDLIAVTGTSGDGKTTFFRLLLGICQPTAGSLGICLGDSERKLSPSAVRKLFAYVPQGNTLLSGTLRENLTMFTDQATDAEILEAVRISCLDDMIAQLRDGLDTVIGERGVGLSEGQAQRVAVARAILSGAPILLLDESTSALDEQTEAKLLENIRQLQGKTCLIVTHRKAALKICDYEMRFENGCVYAV